MPTHTGLGVTNDHIRKTREESKQSEQETSPRARVLRAHIRTTNVPGDITYACDPARDQAKQVGVVEPRLQYIRTVLPYSSNESQGPSDFAGCRMHIQVIDWRDVFERCVHFGWTGERYNHVGEATGIALSDEFVEHSLSTAVRKGGDNVKDADLSRLWHWSCAYSPIPSLAPYGFSTPNVYVRF